MQQNDPFAVFKIIIIYNSYESEKEEEEINLFLKEKHVTGDQVIARFCNDFGTVDNSIFSCSGLNNKDNKRHI